MKIIFRAIYLPRKSLLLTFFMILIFCYVFALVFYTIMAELIARHEILFPSTVPGAEPWGGGTTAFPSPYSGTAIPEDPNLPAASTKRDDQFCCTNMVLCFVCLIDNLIKNDAKIATVILGETYQRANFFEYVVFAYDNIALIILKMLLLEILAGLIIDTFGALRDQDISKNEDLKGSCFICGLQTEEFEKPGCADFDTHILKEHYMWNYISFLAFMKEKNPQDYDGIESYVAKQMANSSISWIPNGKTQFLDQENEQNQVFDNIENMESSVTAISSSLQRMRQIMSNIEQERAERAKDKLKTQMPK